MIDGGRWTLDDGWRMWCRVQAWWLMNPAGGRSAARANAAAAYLSRNFSKAARRKTLTSLTGLTSLNPSDSQGPVVLTVSQNSGTTQFSSLTVLPTAIL